MSVKFKNILIDNKKNRSFLYLNSRPEYLIIMGYVFIESKSLHKRFFKQLEWFCDDCDNNFLYVDCTSSGDSVSWSSSYIWGIIKFFIEELILFNVDFGILNYWKSYNHFTINLLSTGLLIAGCH